VPGRDLRCGIPTLSADAEGSAATLAVQIGTASFTDPRVSERLIQTLTNVLFESKAFTLNEIRDKFLAEND